MLVLSRRLGETIVIEGGIEVMVVAVQGDRVRLGITAPPSVRVDRQEVHERRAEFAAPCRCPVEQPAVLSFVSDWEPLACPIPHTR